MVICLRTSPVGGIHFNGRDTYLLGAYHNLICCYLKGGFINKNDLCTIHVNYLSSYFNVNVGSLWIKTLLSEIRFCIADFDSSISCPHPLFLLFRTIVINIRTSAVNTGSSGKCSLYRYTMYNRYSYHKFRSLYWNINQIKWECSVDSVGTIFSVRQRPTTTPKVADDCCSSCPNVR